MNVERSLVLSVAEDLRRPGHRRPVQRMVSVPGLATSSARVPDAADVGLDLQVEAVGEDIVVEGTVRVPWSASCRRCLEDVEGTVEVPVREVFERRPVEGETYPLGGGSLGDLAIDLTPFVRDAVLLGLPLAPLCSEACPGPDPARFPAGVDEGEASDDAEAPPRDPRWAALDDLRFDDEPS